MTDHSQILYIPTISPPTPSPTPSPPSTPGPTQTLAADPLEPLTPHSRRTFIASVLNACTPDELQYISETISPFLKRDWISALPTEIALCILGFVDSPLMLVRVGAVSRKWRAMAESEELWRRICVRWGFDVRAVDCEAGIGKEDDEPLEEMEAFAEFPMDPALEWLMEKKRKARRSTNQFIPPQEISYRAHFKNSYLKLLRWVKGGRLLRTHRLPMLSSPPLHPSYSYPHPQSRSRIPPPLPTSPPQTQAQPDSGVVTCLALDASWIVVGLASSRIHIFSAKTGVLARTLVGHESGVWGLCLVSAFGKRMEEEWRDRKGKGKEVEREVLDEKGKKRRHKRTKKQGQTHHEDEDTITELWRSLPPSLKTAVGLDSEGEGEDEDDSYPDFNDEDGTEQDSDSVSVDEDGDIDIEGPQLPLQQQTSTSTSTNTNTNTWKAKYVPERQSNPCFASEGWGQPNALVVSGGCDKVVRVWDVKSGHCIYTLPGHTSTIRCMRTLHHRPLAVTGSRDGTLRTWDIQRGRALRVLEGHASSVRCLDVNGRRAVSGSYDTTCRVWDLDTGECLHVLQGHYHQVYSVAFDGVLVATGGLDTTIRIWDAETGACRALLQGHTALVCQLQLSRRHQLLATGGSDGRIITFSLSSSETSGDVGTVLMRPLFPLSNLETTQDNENSIIPTISAHLPPIARIRTQTRSPYEPLYRLSAHTSSVTSLQFDGRFLVTSGNDGCVYVWETRTGRFVRRLGAEGEGVWKVGFAGVDLGRGEERGEGEEVGDVCVVAGRREGKTVLDVWGFGEPPPEL